MYVNPLWANSGTSLSKWYQRSGFLPAASDGNLSVYPTVPHQMSPISQPTGMSSSVIVSVTSSGSVIPTLFTAVPLTATVRFPV